jgi:hypothetical protein
MSQLQVSLLLQGVLGGGGSTSPSMQTLKAAAQLTAPHLTTKASPSLHMGPFERPLAFVGQSTPYRGRNSPPPTPRALNFPSWTSSPSQLSHWLLMAPATLSPYPPDSLGCLERLGLGLEPPRSRGRLGGGQGLAGLG